MYTAQKIGANGARPSLAVPARSGGEPKARPASGRRRGRPLLLSSMDAMVKRPDQRNWRESHRYGSSLVSGEEQVRRPFRHADTRAQLHWHLCWRSSSQISATSSVDALLMFSIILSNIPLVSCITCSPNVHIISDSIFSFVSRFSTERRCSSRTPQGYLMQKHKVQLCMFAT